MNHFEQLYEQYAPEIYRFAYWLTGNPAEAEDITAETFFKAWVRFDTIQTATLKGYLLTIAKNLYLKRRQQTQREMTLNHQWVDPAPRPEEQVAEQWTMAQTWHLIQQLPENDRFALLLCAVHQLSYEEIATVLNLSLSAVKVKIHRARLKLATQLLDKEKKL